MKPHRAPQFELPGQETAFNLAGELLRQDAPPAKVQPDTTPTLFELEPTNPKPQDKRP